MSVLSSDTGRFISLAKIDVKCRCGKKYRVSANKAGKRLRCKKCRSKIQVPGASTDGAVSMRSRKAILAEFGIDPDSAEERYEEEKNQTYNCSVCSCELNEAQLKNSYGADGLTCAGCRSDEKRESESGSGSDNVLDAWTKSGTPEAARRQALTKGTLILVGTTCLLQFFMPVWGAGLIAAAVALAAGSQIHKAALQG
jgi:DNA-directed RNA polymerase subunit RPC12/RpoP